MDEEKEERRIRGERDADAHTTEPVDSREGPARPGTTETGLPDREQLRGERMDLEDVLNQRTQREDRNDLPSQEERGRMDRSELTGQRAQTEDRSQDHDVDTQGGMPRHTADVEAERPNDRPTDIETEERASDRPTDIETEERGAERDVEHKRRTREHDRP